MSEDFRCFWEMVELEKCLEEPKKYEPIPMSANDMLCVYLQNIEFAVKIYDSEAICPNGHIKAQREYRKMDDIYCTQCGTKLLTVTSKEHWEPCRLMILPIVPEGAVSTVIR